MRLNKKRVAAVAIGFILMVAAIVTVVVVVNQGSGSSSGTQLETQRPIEIKDGADDGFGELIPISPAK